MPEDFYSIGRAGTYRYEVDIDDCIEQAFELKRIMYQENGISQHPVLLERWSAIEDINPNLEQN